MPLLSPYAVLQQQASRQPDTEAIVIDDVTITYADLFERVAAASGWLLAHGLIPGQASGLCICDEIEHLVVTIGLLCMGTPQIALASHETGATKRALARKVGATQLIVEHAESWMEGLRTIVLPSGGIRSIRIKASVTPNEMLREYPGDLVSAYRSTSGSTSVPRTLAVTLERILTASKRIYSQPIYKRAARIGSIEHDAHRIFRTFMLLAGNTSIFSRRNDLESIASVCERHEALMLHLRPGKIAAFVRSGADPGQRLPSFTVVWSGGARVPGALRAEAKRKLTDNLWVLYATTEIGTISWASPDQHDRFPEGVGFPDKNLTVEIIDANGDPVVPGEVGELRLRKPGFFNGYVGETFANFADGWFYPRDLVSMKEGEPLIFHGRADDVMILNGINIYPSPIEDVLESHPGVAEAAAYPVKSRIHGDIPVAAVVLKEDAHCNTGELLEICQAVLGIRAPRQIFVVKSLPRNAGGKLLRRLLSERH
jgi:long-chain acyl-CoA synthetase